MLTGAGNVSALTDIGYDGPVCIEVEDRAFEGSREKILESPAPEQEVHGEFRHLSLRRPRVAAFQ